MKTERRVIYEPETNEDNKETGKLLKKIVRVRKEGKYEVVVNIWILQQIWEFFDELTDINKKDTPKILMHEFGISEGIAKVIVNKYLDGTLLDVVGQYDCWEGGMRVI